MGKRARQLRAEEKRLARWFGITQDELGNVRHRQTKAQARRHLLLLELAKRAAEDEIIESITKKAWADICEVEDAIVFKSLEELIGNSPKLEVVRER